MIDYKKLIQHYENIQRLENAGGLRKDLNPEKCVQMYIHHYYPQINILEAMTISNKIKYLSNEINNIPW